MTKKSTFAIAIQLAAATLFTTAAQAGDLRVEVRGLTAADSGTVNVALADKAEGFLKTFLASQRIAAAPGAVLVVFRDLKSGDYAVTAFLDENGNEKLDTNLFGMPTEKYGFSNDARGSFGPPSFADAKFSVGAGGATVVVNLQ